MVSVSGAFATPRIIPVELSPAQAPSVIEASVKSSSDVNPKMLKTLAVQMASVNDPEKMDKIRQTLSQYGYETSDESITNISRMLSANRIKANFALNQFMAVESKIPQDVAEPGGGESEKLTVHTSYKDLWLVMANAIASIKADYVDFYADLMQKYTEMYEHYNNNVQKASAEAVTAGEDGNYVNFDDDIMNMAYFYFIIDISQIDLGSVNNWENMTEAQRQSMVTTLQPAYNIDPDSGKIRFNLSQYQSSQKFPQETVREKSLPPVIRHGLPASMPLAPGCRVICSLSLNVILKLTARLII